MRLPTTAELRQTHFPRTYSAHSHRCLVLTTGCDSPFPPRNDYRPHIGFHINWIF